MGRKARISGAARIERERQVAEILSLRVSGWSLREIGESLHPAISAQAVFKTVRKALERMATEAVQEIRRIEGLRLDEALAAIYPAVSMGDLVAIDRLLAIMARRSRLMGLDVRPMRWAPGAGDEFTSSQVGIEIVNNPDLEHVRRLEAALEEGDPPPRVTSLPSLN
jgi:hypothetical protein